MKPVRRPLLLFVVAVAACLALAPAAHAAFGFTGLAAAPTNTNAGAHSDFNIHIGFTSPSDDVKDLTVGLPPGLVGDPTVTPLCTVAQLQGDSCPSASQVGTVTTSATAHLLGLLPLPLTVDGSLYNLEPAAGQPARFGIVLRPVGSDPLPLLEKIEQVSDVRLRKNDFGLDTVLADIPNVAHAVGQALSVPIDITAIDIHLNGTVGGQGFMRNPTSCGTKTTKFAADSYANPSQTVTGQATYTSQSCASLPFSPTFRAWVGSPGRTTYGTKPPLITQITQDEGEAGLMRARVLLPWSLTPDLLNILANMCPEAQFRSNASACPAGSIVGSATAISPLLRAPQTGGVVIVAPRVAGTLPRLGVDLHGPLSLQLVGAFVSQPGLGQVFHGLPDIPISNFTLRFKAGGILIAGTNLCKPPEPSRFPVSFTGWNGAMLDANVTAGVLGCSTGG